MVTYRIPKPITTTPLQAKSILAFPIFTLAAEYFTFLNI